MCCTWIKQTNETERVQQTNESIQSNMRQIVVTPKISVVNRSSKSQFPVPILISQQKQSEKLKSL